MVSLFPWCGSVTFMCKFRRFSLHIWCRQYFGRMLYFFRRNLLIVLITMKFLSRLFPFYPSIKSHEMELNYFRLLPVSFLFIEHCASVLSSVSRLPNQLNVNDTTDGLIMWSLDQKSFGPQCESSNKTNKATSSCPTILVKPSSNKWS